MIKPFDPKPEIAELVRRWLDGRDVRVLEGGCGSATWIRLPDHWPVTGVDVSAEQLKRHTGLTEKVRGDLQTVRLPPVFDVAVCWNVLEHLDRPADALQHLAEALKPGGLLVVAVPLATSFQGFVTRLTPHWFHVAFYRYVLKREHAGLPGYAPFPTCMRRDIRPQRIKAILGQHGLSPVYERTYTTDHYCRILTAFGPLSWVVRGAATLAAGLSLGRIRRDVSDFVAVFHRNDPASGGFVEDARAKRLAMSRTPPPG